MKLTLQVGPTPPVGVDKPDGSFANTRPAASANTDTKSVPATYPLP